MGLETDCATMEVAEDMNDDDLAASGFESLGHISDHRRVNGFAPGDRVAIVDCELAGAYGKVTDSRFGCKPNCRVDCRLVFVELMSRPPGVEEVWYRQTWASDENTRRFKVAEVVHVD